MDYRFKNRNFKTKKNSEQPYEIKDKPLEEISQEESALLSLQNGELKNQKILCIFQRNSQKEKSIGICYTNLSPQSKTVINTGDFPMYLFDSFPIFISDLQPDFILISSPTDSPLIDFFQESEALKSRVRLIQNMNVQYNSIQLVLQEYFQTNCQLSQVYAYAKVSDILSSLSTCAYSALYTLFNLAVKAKAQVGNLVEDDSTIQFEKIIFDEVLFVGRKTQKELKIFEEKIHPSFVKGQGKSKEGLSLYNMFNRCVTQQGKKLLKNFFQYPLQNEEKIKERYECINQITKNNNYSIIKSFEKDLTQIKDLESIMNELQKFMINFKIWNSIFSSFNAILKIFDVFKKKNLQIRLLEGMFKKINTENVEKIFDFLCNCLEFGKDIKPRIKQGVNELLDQLKSEFGGLDEMLTKLATDYSTKIPKDCFLEKFMFVFIPQLGYMLAVEKNEKYYRLASKVFQDLIENQEGDDQRDVSLEDNLTAKKDSFYSTEKKGRSDLDSQSHGDFSSSKKYSFSSSSNPHQIQGGLDNLMTQILEEDEMNSQLENKNNPVEENVISFQKGDNPDGEKEVCVPKFYDLEDEEVPEFQNFEETLILQKIKFPGLNLQFQFHSNDMIYYKNEITTQLDRDYGDLSARITDVENAIFREISRQILEFASDIKATNSFVAYLDVFLHLSLITEKYLVYQPNISSLLNVNSESHSPFSFNEARNLITELTTESTYIKNSFSSENKSIFLICGNASSGKSAFIRMVGMLVYLAQIGCFVPAKDFNFDVFNKILTNIEISESTIDHMSGFTIELKEIKEILNLFEKDFDERNIRDCNVLVLLDNPFMRTSLHNQKCLLHGTIKHLTNKIKQAQPNKKCSIFITVSNEIKEFLVQSNSLDFSITQIYEMKSAVQDKTILNYYKLEKCEMEEEFGKENVSGRRLLLAKESGLNNLLFLRSLQIYRSFTHKSKIFPNIEKVSQIANNFEAAKKDILLLLEKYSQEGEESHQNKEEEGVEKEIIVLEQLNKLILNS